MIYPSAFSTTTGPIYWTFLHRARYVNVPQLLQTYQHTARAVDNQMYVAMCSPARNLKASYQAVRAMKRLYID